MQNKAQQRAQMERKFVMGKISIEEIMKTEPALQNSLGAPVPLEGGLMNRLYRVDTEHKSYCVKIFGSQAGNLTLDRKDEIEACEQAGALGVSPAVAASSREKGYYITDFFNGPPLDQFNIHHTGKLEQVASLVKTIHQNMHVNRNFGAFELIDRYTENISRLKAPVPEGYAGILKKTRKYEKNEAWIKPIATCSATTTFGKTTCCTPAARWW